MSNASPTELLWGGTGGAYFLASPGELVIDLVKRDRNITAAVTEMRALLVSPDRRVLQEERIPDSGQPAGSGLGPPQRVRLSTQVEHRGVYVLNITVSHDRYGEAALWGFETNCPHYLIETSRGHKDEAHTEPIVLMGSGEEADVCFLPRSTEFEVEVSELPDGVGDLSVFDGQGALVGTLQSDGAGGAAGSFSGDASGEIAPWRLHLPTQQAVIRIDGVTHWEKDDPYQDMSYWTPRIESFFALHDHRWLLTPYRRAVYVRPGQEGQAGLRIHNNAGQPSAIGLSVDGVDGPDCSVQLSTERVELGSGEATDVALTYAVPEGLAEDATATCYVRATPLDHPELSTYASVTLKNGEALATRDLAMPLVLKPYEHENEQFGYLPDYPTESQLYFDPENRPYVAAGSRLQALRDGGWESTSLDAGAQPGSAELKGAPNVAASGKVAFDGDNNAYVVASGGGRGALIRSGEQGRSVSAIDIGREDGRSSQYDIEDFTGQNALSGPPPLLRGTYRASDEKLFWRRLNDLELLLPEEKDGELSTATSIPISSECIGVSAHSGIVSSLVSRGDKVHMVWAEATEPGVDAPGVPTYVATYDRSTGMLSEKVLVGYGPPPNDCHNSPSITMDSQGYLHVVAGTHGSPFPYARSLKPNDTQSGWTEAELVSEGARQTYIGLVCGPDDTLHMAFRLWLTNTEWHPISAAGTLAYMQKRPGEPWSEPRPLIIPPFSEYSVYYHRLTIDRKGRLFLSYTYYTTYWFYRNDQQERHRAVLMSSDGGRNWKLVGMNDLVAGTEG